MDNPVLQLLPLPSSTLIPFASFTDNGFFYTDTPPQPIDDMNYTPDRKYLFIGFALGVFMLILLVIGLIFAIKLYLLKREKETAKERYMYQVEEIGGGGDQWMMAEEEESFVSSQNHSSSTTNISQSGSSSKKFQLLSILDPGSQFSLAIQRASEIPNSPTNTISNH